MMKFYSSQDAGDVSAKPCFGEQLGSQDLRYSMKKTNI